MCCAATAIVNASPVYSNLSQECTFQARAFSANSYLEPYYNPAQRYYPYNFVVMNGSRLEVRRSQPCPHNCAAQVPYLLDALQCFACFLRWQIQCTNQQWPHNTGHVGPTSVTLVRNEALRQSRKPSAMHLLCGRFCSMTCTAVCISVTLPLCADVHRSTESPFASQASTTTTCRPMLLIPTPCTPASTMWTLCFSKFLQLHSRHCLYHHLPRQVCAANAALATLWCW